MKVRLPIICAMTFAMSVSSVFAGDGKDSSKPVASQAVSWEEFRARCQNPKDFDRQVAPENIHISCSNVETEFVSEAPGIVPLTTTRRVSTTVYSSKWHVGGVEAKDIAIAQKNGSCLKFKEVERQFTIERPLSCSEILGMKGNIEDYCTSALDQARSQNPKMITTRDTGRYVDTCSGISITTSNDKPSNWR